MKNISVTDIPEGSQLIDVREAPDFVEGHPAGAINIPFSEFGDRVAELDTDRDIYVMCYAGIRSQHIVGFLEQHGIEAINVLDGARAWVSAGLPLVSGKS